MSALTRGNPSLMRNIQSAAKKVSQERGISTPISDSAVNEALSQAVITEGGAANYLRRKQAEKASKTQGNPVIAGVRAPISTASAKSGLSEDYLSLLMENVELAKQTKEYGSMAISLFKLYLSNSLNYGVIDKIDPTDLKEVRAIFREFMSML